MTRQGINLEEKRLNKGLSIREAGRQMGVGADTIKRAEEGRRVRPRSALKIADFYECQVTDIWPVDDAEAVAA